MRRLFALLAVLAALFVTRAASAQSINLVSEASLPRYDAEGRQLQKRTTNLSPEAVSLQDCVDDQRIRFSFLNSGYEANSVIEPWASITGDCKSVLARGGVSGTTGGVATCWRIGPAISLVPNASIDIPVRAIMSGVGRVGTPDATANICGKIDLANVNVQFVYIPPGANQGGDATVSKNVTIIVDTVGPAPPSGLRALPGDTRIHVRWTSISGGSSDASASTSNSGAGLTELTGIKIYCALNEAGDGGGGTIVPAATQVCTDAGDDGGDGGDGGVTCTETEAESDSGSPNSETCGSSAFVNADGSSKLPDTQFNNLYECGSLAGNVGSAVTAEEVAGRPLVNGTTYAVALAATDKYGNVGPLSSVVCERPEETTDFWNNYKRAGGDGGGCATGGDSPAGSLATLGIAASAIALSLARRRRP